MDKLDAGKLIEAFDDEMKRLGEERDHAARNQWFDKAAKFEKQSSLPPAVTFTSNSCV
jgi:hypothetical protein